jgi:hypothetical protein
MLHGNTVMDRGATLRAKGCLTILVVLPLLVVVIPILVLTWPVGLLAGLAACGWFFTKGSKETIKSAAHAVLGPITIGLLLVSALLLVFNLASPSEDVVGNAERSLVYLDNKVPSWSKLSPGMFVGAILSLIALTYWMPRLKLITKFIAVKKFSSKATAVLGAATSFTFFSNVDVVQPNVPAIYLKIEAIYRHSREGERQAIDRFLAAKAVQQALMNQNPSGREYCGFLIDGIAAIPTMDMASKQSLASFAAQQLPYDRELTAKIERPSIGPTSLPHRSALSIMDAQLSTERAASVLAEEANKATKELLSHIFDLGTDELKSIAWSFLDKLIAEQADAVDQLARPLIDKIIDKYFEKYTDPIVTKQAEAVQHLFDYPGSGPTAAKVAADSEMRSAMELMNATEAESAGDAANQALEAAQAAKIATNAGDTARADTELADAERASAQSLKAADLAKAASESMTKVPEALRASPNEARDATIAIGVIEATQGVQIVTETSEAAKVARSAAQAAEAAKVARSAVQAAEAAKVASSAAQAAEAAKVARSAAEAVEAARAARGAAEAAEAAKLLLKTITK